MNEIRDILVQLYSISEILFNLENYIHTDSGKVSDGYKNETSTKCCQCRTLIAQIFFQIILMFLDNDVFNSLPNFRINIPGEFGENFHNFKTPIKLKDLFEYSTFRNKRLYTYFSYILVTYLARFKMFSNEMNKIIPRLTIQSA